MHQLHVSGTCLVELFKPVTYQLHYVCCKNPKTKQTDKTIEKHTEEDPIHITNFAVAFQKTILKV